MSTQRAELERAGLCLYEEDGEPHRQLWFAPLLLQWLDETLPYAQPPEEQNGHWFGEDEPIEQVFMAIAQYAYNPLFRNVGEIVNITPQSDGVWELKTDDVRIFGWFYRRKILIVSEGRLKGGLSTSDVNAVRHLVLTYRRRLRLTPPEHVYTPGRLPHEYL